jgi:NADH-quinone oxidoreductase subunit E
MVQINADYYEDLTPESFTRILNDFSLGKPPKPGPQIDRQNSAPIGGPTTLIDPSLYLAKGKSTQQPTEAAIPKPALGVATIPKTRRR